MELETVSNQRFFIHSCIYLRILIISCLATFIGTNNLSVLIADVPKTVNQSINYSSLLFWGLQPQKPPKFQPHKGNLSKTELLNNFLLVQNTSKFVMYH